MKKLWLLTGLAIILTSGPGLAADDAVAKGKLVKVDYTLTVNNEQLETSAGKEPLRFVVGDQTIIPGLESGLMGMHVGEEKVITVAAKDAYGEPDAKALKEFPKSAMPAGSEPKVGMVLQAQAPDGESFPATIAEVKEDKVMLDFNHPLAGKQLEFKVKIISIEPAPAAPASPVTAVAPATPAGK